MPTPSPARWAGAALVGVWTLLSISNLHSVADFQPLTVVGLTLCLPALLGLLLLTRRHGLAAPPAWSVAAGLALSALAVASLRYFAYLPDDPKAANRWLVVGADLLCASLWLVPRRAARTGALLLAGAALVATTWVAVRYDPVPRIDVWLSLDQGATGLLHGRDPYASSWVGSPGVGDAFTYLPTTLVLLAPFRWVLGDVRWGLTVALLLAALVLARWRPEDDGRDRGADARAGALLLLLTPGQLAQTEQSWTEPLLLLFLVLLLAAARTGRLPGAVASLAVLLSTKQHMALLVPGLLAWRRFGPRRTLVGVVAGGLLCLPWFLWGPADFLHDTVTLLLSYPPLRLSPNLYVAAFRAGWTPPFWLTGLVLLGTLAGTTWAVRREQPGPGRLALWWAVLLLVLNLTNKQAFYNQFWLVGSLLLVCLAAAEPALPAPSGSEDDVDDPRRRRARLVVHR